MSTAFSSLMLMTRSAPNPLPIASRPLRVPVRMTELAPSALATATASSPIGPGPITTTLPPATNPPSSVSAYIEVPAVTTSVTSASLMVSGTRASVLMWLTAYSAKPPSVVNPLAR